MIDALVLSVPRSGTRFYLYFLREVLGIKAGYAHFGFTKDERIIELAGLAKTVIIARRPVKKLRASWDGFRKDDMEASIVSAERMEQTLVDNGALFMDIEKGKHTSSQFTELLLALEKGWNAEVVQFIDEWPIIGSKHGKPNDRDIEALESAILARV